MKLGIRIFFGFLLILALAFHYPINYALDTLRTRYLEGVEDPLADQANILAELAAREFKSPDSHLQSPETDPPDFAAWGRALDKAHGRSLGARIYNLEKERVDMQIYVTDTAGRVIYDSEDPRRIGEDYSRWRDVKLALEGEYGARTTQKDPAEPLSSVLYVAAPIRVDNTVVGVLTVAKPTTNINNFLEEAKPHITRVGLVSGLGAMLAGLLLTFWWTRPMGRLTRYAEAVGQGRRMPFPRLDKTEIGDLGRAFERMQAALEGKKYVEHYVQNLTHELKSPLSAIRGAAELMGEKGMSDSQRQRFLQNITAETDRVRHIVDRMLALASLESRKMLQKRERVALPALVNTVLEGMQTRIVQSQLTAEVHLAHELCVRGDGFLLHQAVSNLVQNAVEFSPEKGRLILSARTIDDMLELEVLDEGPGIPEYALPRIFDKFYSLRRPAGGAKSTGLGLNFVREIAELHGGAIDIANRGSKGVRARLTLPRFQ